MLSTLIPMPVDSGLDDRDVGLSYGSFSDGKRQHFNCIAERMRASCSTPSRRGYAPEGRAYPPACKPTGWKRPRRGRQQKMHGDETIVGYGRSYRKLGLIVG